MSQSISTPSADTHPADAPVGDDHAHGPHVVSRWILLAVYVALVILTGITVTVSKIDIGQFNIFVALAVAVLKSTLVALFFMHLFWDSPFNSIILVAALFFVALFIGMALLDTHSYEPALTAPQGFQVGQ